MLVQAQCYQQPSVYSRRVVFVHRLRNLTLIENICIAFINNVITSNQYAYTKAVQGHHRTYRQRVFDVAHRGVAGPQVLQAIAHNIPQLSSGSLDWNG